MSFHYFLNTYLDGVEETAAESARNFKQAMNNKEPNSLNSIQECCAARQTAENALDALHTEAIETELDKLERLEQAADPGPWTTREGDEGVWTKQTDRLFRVLLREPCNRNLMIALRNAAPKLIFQAKNIANIVSDLDEVHAALGTDYNSQAAPDVRKLQREKNEAEYCLQTQREQNERQRQTIFDFQNRRDSTEPLKTALKTERTINENLRGTVAALREKLESCGNTSALERNLENQSETIRCLWKERDELRNQLKDRQAYRVKLERELRGYRLDSLASLNPQAQTIREYKELNTRVNSEVLALRERERQLLSSLASVRRQNDNLCAANSERFERIKQLGRDLSAERSDKDRLQTLLDLAKKEVEVFKTCWKPRLPKSSFLHSFTGKIVQNLQQALGKPVRCSDGTVRILLCVCGSGYNYKYAPPESNGDCWIDEGGAQTLFIGGTILD